jgi:hypothetical protein
MDDDFQQLESELKRLQPARPSPALRARVERELAAPSAPPRRRRASPAWRWLWLAFPAAAALAVMLTIGGRDREPDRGAATAGAGTLRPVAAENVLYSAIDEGWVTLDDGTTAHRQRLQYVDTITWRDPRTNASLTWSVPREEVRVVPVVFY